MSSASPAASQGRRTTGHTMAALAARQRWAPRDASQLALGARAVAGGGTALGAQTASASLRPRGRAASWESSPWRPRRRLRGRSDKARRSTRPSAQRRSSKGRGAPGRRASCRAQGFLSGNPGWTAGTHLGLWRRSQLPSVRTPSARCRCCRPP
eukprot:9489278-Pyramimonas_sp.AAC.1